MPQYYYLSVWGTNLLPNVPQMSFLAYLGNISSAYSTSKKRVICSDLPPGWQSIVSEPGWGTRQLKLSQTGLSFRLIYNDCLRRSRIRISLFSCCVIYWICIMPEGKHWSERIGGWGGERRSLIYPQEVMQIRCSPKWEVSCIGARLQVNWLDFSVRKMSYMKK